MARSIYCYDCKAEKENPKKGYCRACTRKRDNEWRISTGRTQKHRTGKCACGNEFAPYNPTYCTSCAAKKRKDYLARNPDVKKKMQDRGVKLRTLNYVSKSKGRIRRKGTLINGEPVNCKVCDALSEGWCKDCDLLYQIKKRQYEASPDKIKTRALTRANIKAGKLVKGPCEVCGTKEIIEAHHDDYTKPNQIRWLCREHHAAHHKALNK